MISRWLGAYIAVCQHVCLGCQNTLKVKPEQRALSQCLGLSLLQQLQPYVHRGRATISYVFLCVYLSCCLYCALFALPLCLSARLHHCSGPSLIRFPTFGLWSFTKVAISAGMASCSRRFQDNMRTPKTPWLANIVWAFSWVKLLRDIR